MISSEACSFSFCSDRSWVDGGALYTLGNQHWRHSDKVNAISITNCKEIWKFLTFTINTNLALQAIYGTVTQPASLRLDTSGAEAVVTESILERGLLKLVL